MHIHTLIHQWVSTYIRPGDHVLDATVGNGLDTLFLAHQVGEEGKVYGFDIQEEALARTCRLLQEAGMSERVQLFCAGHEALDKWLPAAAWGNLAVAMFNLGYLPGGNKQIITQPETTLLALRKALRALRVQGFLSVVLYEGHAGGLEEARLVRSFAAALPADAFSVWYLHKLNTGGHPPSVLFIEKLKNVELSNE